VSTEQPAPPDTIVLIHGLWMTPRSWEHSIDRFQGHGHRVPAPAYPGLDVEVEAPREDPLADRGAHRFRHGRALRAFLRSTGSGSGECCRFA
jgi:pimeloyl-ACP methyl ester carboxylesterase